MNGATPQVSTTAPMAFGRRQHNLTVLADGTVLATGGNSSGASLVDLNAGVYPAELWDPATGQWRTLAAMQITRQYHSTALLLPDGRVLSSGGGICGTCDQVGYLAKNAEIFSPPYLFQADGTLAPRPAIDAAPASTSYGAAMQIATGNPTSIRKVALVRLGAVTHSNNMEQRYIPLSFTAGATSITATAPANANIAPPGFYMLFIIDANGVPSVARMVSVQSNSPAVTLTQPTDGATFSAPATVNLAATASDADGTLTKVEFFNGAAKLGEDTTAPYSFTWSGVATGNYTLTARATDDLGATTTSAASTITVTSNTNSPPTVKPPTINSFSPAAGAVGSQLTLSGTNLSSVTQATISGSNATITPVSATQLKLTVPAGAQTGPISLTNLAGQTTSVASFKVTPKLASFTPVSGIRGSQTQITGTTFTGATAVKFGSIAASNYTVDDDSHITVTVPNTATTSNITVTTPAGNSNALAFTVILPPTITSFSPTAGVAGRIVTINGTNLAAPTGVTFNGTSATTITPVSPTQVKATVPAGAQTGPISLTNLAGQTTSVASFRVTPKLASFAPISGIRGSQTQITGTTFTGATAVKFGSIAASNYTVDDDSHITVTVPNTATTSNITVTTPAGNSNALAFTVILPPTINSFSPAAGAVGSQLTLSGTNLSSVTQATISGSNATITPVSATQLKLTVPAGAQTGPISLTNLAGQTTSVASFRVTPKLASFTPVSGIRGSQTQITGTTFTGATAVKFGSIAASNYTVDDDSHITVTVPNTATTSNITVTTPAGNSNALAFTVILPPTINGFSPAAGVAGRIVTINGTNLAAPTGVTFNGTSATTITPVSPTQVKATVPPGATSGKIGLSTVAGTATSANDFTVPLTITSFAPQSGIEGDTVTITGTGFTNVKSVTFGTVQTGASVNSDTQLTATVPIGATDGPISVSDGSLTTQSASSFDVISVQIPAQRIVWQSNNLVGFAVWSMNGDSTNQTALSTNSDSQPAWSPDGTEIAFISGRDGNSEIYATKADGSAQTRLTQTGSSNEAQPAWSPDGSKIAYSRLDPNTNGQGLWVMNADGSGQTQLTTTADSYPSWSPDGTKIAFQSNRNGNAEIYSMNADGSAQTNLTNAPTTNEMDPDWSPDGAQIVFASDAHSQTDIYRMNADGSGVTRLTTSGSDGMPVWGPCSRIVFSSFRTLNQELFIMLPNGAGQVRLTNNAQPGNTFPEDLFADC